MNRFKITIEYDGTDYCGWQNQPGCISIQEAIEKAATTFANHKVIVYGSGRTDSGVHAIAQTAHLNLEKDWPEETIVKGINYFLKPQPISIISAQKMSDAFNARFSAKKRYYRYHIINRAAPIVLDRNRAWNITCPLSVDKMKEAAVLLEGTHDFSSFRASICSAKSPIRTIDYIKITKDGERITFDVCGQSFLHHMVRIMVGALYMVGSGRWSLSDLQNYRDAKNSRMQKFAAPACGLYLVKIDY